MKIGIFLPNWIGDAVMATPALRALRRKFADAEIVAIMRPYVAEVLDGLHLADRTIFHEPRTKGSTNRGWRFVTALRREKFDTVLILPNSLRTGWLAWLSGAARRVGFDRDGRGWMLTDRVAPKLKGEPHPAIDEYLRLAAHVGCDNLARNMELATTDRDEDAIQQFWNRYAEELRARGVICLNPGGAFGSAKHWPSESFGGLARRIACELNKAVLVLCGPQERDEARQIVASAGHPNVVSMSDCELSIGMTKAAIKHSELLITTDSGPRHFAAPFDVPVVTLFGPTHIAWSETFYPRAIHLQLDVDCGPCQQRVCPLEHHRCMKDLSVDRVFNSCVALLERTSQNRTAA